MTERVFSIDTGLGFNCHAGKLAPDVSLTTPCRRSFVREPAGTRQTGAIAKDALSVLAICLVIPQSFPK